MKSVEKRSRSEDVPRENEVLKKEKNDEENPVFTLISREGLRVCLPLKNVLKSKTISDLKTDTHITELKLEINDPALLLLVNHLNGKYIPVQTISYKIIAEFLFNHNYLNIQTDVNKFYENLLTSNLHMIRVINEKGRSILSSDYSDEEKQIMENFCLSAETPDFLMIEPLPSKLKTFFPLERLPRALVQKYVLEKVSKTEMELLAKCSRVLYSWILDVLYQKAKTIFTDETSKFWEKKILLEASFVHSFWKTVKNEYFHTKKEICQLFSLKPKDVTNVDMVVLRELKFPIRFAINKRYGSIYEAIKKRKWPEKEAEIQKVKNDYEKEKMKKLNFRVNMFLLNCSLYSWKIRKLPDSIKQNLRHLAGVYPSGNKSFLVKCKENITNEMERLIKEKLFTELYSMVRLEKFKEIVSKL